jgi:hypothetical protein
MFFTKGQTSKELGKSIFLFWGNWNNFSLDLICSGKNLLTYRRKIMILGDIIIIELVETLTSENISKAYTKGFSAFLTYSQLNQ